MVRSASLVFALVALTASRAGAGANNTWKQIDVAARLGADGRYQVVETHDLRLDEGGGFQLEREIGLAVDQDVVFRALTRVDPDGTEHRVVESPTDGPDLFNYYRPKCRLYIGVPPLPAGATLAYRFEYELVHAVSPAWGFAARHEPLFAGPVLRASPRLWQVVTDLREAPPLSEKRYRLDHDVISPRRDTRFNDVQSIRYHLDLAPEWARIDADAEPGHPTPDKDYRVRRVLRFVGPGRPARAATAEATTRWLALAAMPIGGLVLVFVLVAVETVRARRFGVDRAFVERHLASVAPEMVRLLIHEDGDVPTPHEVLTRLAAERRISVEFSHEETEGLRDVRLQLLVPRESLRPFEREVVDSLFAGSKECTTAGLRAKYKREGFDLATVVRAAATKAIPQRLAATWSVADVPAVLVVLCGVALQIRGFEEMLPIVLIPNVLGFVVMVCFSTAWWHPGRSLRPTLALLLPVAILGTGAFLYEISWDCPIAPTAWIGAAVSVLGAQLYTLRRARVPARGGWEIVRNLNRIRGYAAAHLRRRHPDLADAWVPHLLALGLGRRLDRWRARFGDAAFEPGSATAGPPFTGRGPAAFTAKGRWTDALVVDTPED
jgi:hypothetical protein